MRHLSRHKGRFDTYDVAALASDLESYRSGTNVAFPAYSRVTHEPVPEAIVFHEKRSILIIEGLWLLFDVEPWADLTKYYDLSLFFNADVVFRRQNTVSRHLKGGKMATEAEAEAFYEQSDAKNTEQILTHIAPHDMDITIN